MKKHLIILGAFPPDISANGIVVDGIIQEAIKHNDVVFTVLCLTSNPSLAKKSNNAIFIFRVLSRYGIYLKFLHRHREKYYSSKGRLEFLPVRILLKLYYHWAKKIGLYEVFEHRNEILSKANELIASNIFDSIVTVSHPFTCQEIGYKLKIRHPHIKWIAYMLDSNAENAVEKGNLDNEIKIFERTDKIIINPTLINDSHFEEYFSQKTFILPYPIHHLSSETRKSIDKKLYSPGYSLTFAGLFYKKIRNPLSLMELFVELPNDYILHLFSRGCKDTVDKYKTILGNQLNIYGFVKQAELFRHLSSTDILINLGNSVANAIPSKIFEYISFGKPIINLYQIEEDLVNVYLENYPMAINISVDRLHEKEIINAIVEFCKKYKGVRLSYEDATKNLVDFRIENVAKEFIRIID